MNGAITRRAWLGLAVGGGLLAGSRARADEDALPLLDAVPLTIEGDVALEGPVHLTLKRDDSAALAAALRASHGKVDATADGVRVRLAQYRPVTADRPQGFTRPSFLLDYDEPAFAPVGTLAKAYLEKNAGEPKAVALTAFVAEFITKKNRMRGFDVASVVAKRAEGDCTEHAVLLAALLRANGIAARVICGLVLLKMAKPLAFGHAWAEAWVDGGWKPFDAAITAKHRLGLFAITNEGAGFSAALVAKYQALQPTRLVLAAG
ncbi:lasso peptide biosynthesis protein [Pendulispora rubella]|uniref:Lasso peptide biosynthesis protein n=1 Tax=Pendulispora rubella TaxID=2741070 RepID=A0ABZ2L5J3_9BACT